MKSEKQDENDKTDNEIKNEDASEETIIDESGTDNLEDKDELEKENVAEKEEDNKEITKDTDDFDDLMGEELLNDSVTENTNSYTESLDISDSKIEPLDSGGEMGEAPR